jgi:hypothetical protein
MSIIRAIAAHAEPDTAVRTGRRDLCIDCSEMQILHTVVDSPKI